MEVHIYTMGKYCSPGMRHIFPHAGQNHTRKQNNGFYTIDLVAGEITCIGRVFFKCTDLNNPNLCVYGGQDMHCTYVVETNTYRTTRVQYENATPINDQYVFLTPAEVSGESIITQDGFNTLGRGTLSKSCL